MSKTAKDYVEMGRSDFDGGVLWTKIDADTWQSKAYRQGYAAAREAYELLTAPKRTAVQTDAEPVRHQAQSKHSRNAARRLDAELHSRERTLRLRGADRTIHQIAAGKRQDRAPRSANIRRYNAD